MKIAIIGAGFCGLAVAWHLLQQFSKANIHLFDANEIGKSTSGIAAGLLHPFAGAHAKLNRMGNEGMQETQQLLQVASNALGKSVISLEKGILRLALTREQQEDYFLCSNRYPSAVEWIDSQACQRIVPNCAHVPGIWIKEGLSVYSSLYLEGLWLACQQKGAHFHKRFVVSLEDLNDFDQIIVTCGAATRHFPELSHLPLNNVKGQVLEFAWPSSHPPLPCALNSHAYIVMSHDKKSYFAGATYERDYSSKECQPAVALADIGPKIIAMLPYLKNSPLLKCYVGFRSVTPNHLPLLTQLSPKLWVLTGMGSKGLLYHALMAKKLVTNIS